MKLEHDDSHNIESFGTLKEETFSIGDMGFVLEILRNKLYSNIKKAICQEYTSNARDAHREVGKGDVPIQITLPTFLDPNWHCRDFGPGISPERITNIFIQYGVSTKRESNDFTGSYGIGAKSAFGYSDSFIVNTFIKGIKRSYGAIIDESRRGKFVLLSETETNEPDGTEIVVPVRREHFNEFRFETERATRHWNPRPNVIDPSGTFKYTETDAVLSGADWFILNGHYGFNVILDGIIYPIDRSLLDTAKLPKLYYNSEVYLKFNTGDLAVSANRESVELNERTKNNIYLALDRVKSELIDSLMQKITAAKTFKEANLCFAKACSTIGNLVQVKDLSWQGHTLIGNHLRIGDYNVTATAMHYERKGKSADGKPAIKKVTRNPSSSLPIDGEETLFLTTPLDFNKVVETGVQKVLEKHPDIQNVWVIKVATPELASKLKIDLIADFPLDAFYVPKARRESISRLTIYKMNSSGDFSRVAYKEFEADTNPKAYVLLDNKHPFGSCSNLCNIARSTNLSVYGFDKNLPAEKLEDVTSELQTVEEFVEQYINTCNVDIDEVLTYENLELYNYKFYWIRATSRTLLNNLDKFTNVNSPMLQFLTEIKRVSERQNELSKYSWLKHTKLATNAKADAKKIEATLDSLRKGLNFKYPMLDEIRSEAMFVHYVNMVDTLGELGYTIPVAKIDG